MTTLPTYTLSSPIVPVVLSHDNYANWSALMKNYLLAHDLWDIVEATTEPPKPKDDEVDKFNASRKKNNAKALFAIQSSCGVDILSEIREISSAQIVWDKLATMYGPSSLLGIPNDSRVNMLSRIREMSYARIVWDKFASTYKPGNSSNIPGSSAGAGSNEELRNYINEGKSSAMRDYLRRHEGATSAKISVNGRTALHTAVFAGGMEIVEILVNESMSPEELAIPDDNGVTALAQAVILPNLQMVKCMHEKNRHLVNIGDNSGRVPLILALECGNIEVARYIYSVISTPYETLRGITGSTALTLLILLNVFDLALDLLKACPDSAVVPNMYNTFALGALASMPSAFPSGGKKLVFWKNWIYACIPINRAVPSIYNRIPIDIHKSNEQQSDQVGIIGSGIPINRAVPSIYNPISIDIHKPNEQQSDQVGIIGSVLGQLRRLPSNLLKCLGIKEIYEMKLLHHQALELLFQMLHIYVLRLRSSSNENQEVAEMNANYVNEVIFQAIKGGVIEFIIEMVKLDHLLWYTTDEIGRTIFSYAVLHRQAKIFSLIYSLDDKNSITTAMDTSRSTILHMAAMLEPSTARDRIAGEALKMQSELQWFKEVEKICPSLNSEIRNNSKMTARELFTHNHKDMVKEGEKWMKGTATSCTVVGALIMTIMFTSAFTVPGGNDQNTGFPMFSHKPLFMVFIIFDAVSLISSSTSVLVFLGILTSRYAEKDFLLSLPKKMIIGLFTLFFSIATMMTAFCAGLFILIPEKLWITIPVICLASVTVILFAFMQFPILFDMIKSTYGPSIFDRKMKRALQEGNQALLSNERIQYITCYFESG